MDRAGDSVEKTVVVTMPIASGKDWLWIADCNTFVLSDKLDAAGRVRALDDLQATWRRQWITLVPDLDEGKDTPAA